MSQNVTKGYLKKPIILQIINMVYFIIPLYYIFAYIVLCLAKPSLAHFIYNTIFFLGVMTIGSLFIAINIYQTNKIGWYAVIIHSILVFAHNIYTLFNPYYRHKEDSIINLVTVVLFNIIMIGVILYFVVIHSKFRVLFFTPRLRWWESKPRFEFSIPAEITVNDVEYEIRLVDVSVGGIKIAKEDTIPFDERFDYYISFKYENIPVFSSIKLIWIHEICVGAKFIYLSAECRSNIKKIVKIIKQTSKNSKCR